MPKETIRRRALALNAAIAALCAFAWCQMAFGWGSEHGPLSAFGLETLKYFTTLSNILSAVVSTIFVVHAARYPSQPVPDWLHVLRLAATTSVALTFLTVELFLAPSLGYAALHAGANLWFHLLLPLMAIASFCIFEADRPIPVRATLLAIAPMILYGAGYYANLLVNGMGEWPNSNDWYGFAQWGMDKAPLVFAVMALATWAIALVLRAANQRMWRLRH